MREYKILTDSTTDLSPQLVAQTGVTVLPMTCLLYTSDAADE